MPPNLASKKNTASAKKKNGKDAAYVNHSFICLLENQTCFHARQKRAQNVEVFKSEQASALGRRS